MARIGAMSVHRVRDLDQSRAFYERLGWRRSALNAEEVAFFQVGGLVLSLFPREHLAKDAGLSPEGSGFCGLALAYNTRSKEEVEGRFWKKPSGRERAS